MEMGTQHSKLISRNSMYECDLKKDKVTRAGIEQFSKKSRESLKSNYEDRKPKKEENGY